MLAETYQVTTAPEHEELPVGDVHDPHDAEDQGQPQRGQRQDQGADRPFEEGQEEVRLETHARGDGAGAARGASAGGKAGLVVSTQPRLSEPVRQSTTRAAVETRARSAGRRPCMGSREVLARRGLRYPSTAFRLWEARTRARTTPGGGYRPRP